MISFEHHLSELKQIQLIQKKLAQKLENTQSFDRPVTITEVVDNLDYASNFATNLTTILSTKQVKRKVLDKLNHELRTPLVPIHAYTDMLLSEKFGKLSDEQTNKLRIVNSNIRKLEETINNLLNENQFNVTDSENENHTDTSQVVKELQQEKLILGKIVQNEEKKLAKLSRKNFLVAADLLVLFGLEFTVYS